MTSSVHSFDPSRPSSRCKRCQIVLRWKKGNGVFYAYRATGPWFEEELPCAPLGLENDWKTKPIVMLDVETTGVDWTTGHLVEIAFVEGHLEPITIDGSTSYSLVVDRSYCSLVRPPESSRTAFEEAKKAHHIEWDAARAAPDLTTVLSECSALLADAHDRDALLSAYNADFDHRYVVGAYLRSGLAVPTLLEAPQDRDLLDPMQWSRALVPKYTKGGHKLAVVAQRNGLFAEGDESKTHRADFDAELALKVLAFFAKDVPEDYKDLIYFQRAARAEWASHFFGEYMPQKNHWERVQALVDARLAELGYQTEDDDGIAAFIERQASRNE